jgi:hypothetical protein
VARSKNSDWYVGAITNDNREITVSFDFLKDGAYSVELLTDKEGDPVDERGRNGDAYQKKSI